MPDTPSTSIAVHVVAHTHWDREWYLPAGRVRQRLVALIDDLLERPPSSAAPFLLDGQAVVLDDYLAVRPERHDRLAAQLRSGAIEAGPWFVLADELIPSGEALVRNLLLGRATLSALGAEPLPVLYSPDAFGHSAALPTIAAGFGLPLIIVWRGYGGPAWPTGDVARWRAADGSSVLLYHLPPDGYEFGSALPSDAAAAAARWARVRDVLAPRAALGLALLTSGADHHAPPPDLDRAIAALARAAAPHDVHRGSLAAFADELARRAATAVLPTVSGELRDSYAYTWTLQGTFAVRAALKRRAARAERLLVREAEPWAALAMLRARGALGEGEASSEAPGGVPGTERRTQGASAWAALLRAAWRALLLCHPHDTLCGCSIDEVARAMAARLDDAVAQARGIAEDAVLDVLAHDRVRARAAPERWRAIAVVVNRAAWARGGVAELEVARFRQHVPVGPGSGGAPVADRAPAAFSLDGGRVPVQRLVDGVRHDRVESPVHYPDDDLVDTTRVVAWVEPVAGYGTTSIPIDGAAPESSLTVEPVRVRAGEMDNGRLRVTVSDSGMVRLERADAATAIGSLIAWEDVGDVGDLYTHSPRTPVIGPAEFLGSRVVHAGPLRGELHAAWRIDVPRASTPAGRAPDTVPLVANVALTLDARAPVLRIRAWGENPARDHRLRLVLRTDLARADVWADAAFGPVRRVPIATPPESAEQAPPTAPLARYVTLATATRGVTIFSDGLAEYEATPAGDVAITLVRAVGELSRNDLPERPGHAGWPCATPLAQSLGPFAGEFAVLPHGPRDAHTIALVERIADDVLLPLVGCTLRPALDVYAPTAGVALHGAGLAFSACKPSEDGAWVVLRCVNLLDDTVDGRWECGVAITDARVARLDETPLAPIESAAGSVAFRAGPRAVVTILVR